MPFELLDQLNRTRLVAFAFPRSESIRSSQVGRKSVSQGKRHCQLKTMIRIVVVIVAEIGEKNCVAAAIDNAVANIGVRARRKRADTVIRATVVRETFPPRLLD